MARKPKKEARPNVDRLQSKIEQVQDATPSTAERSDGFDGELKPYVEAFLQGLPEAVKLEKFSLETPEQAQKALGILTETIDRLNRQVANAQALQKLMSNVRSE